ncbi:copper/zinc superoxide dismutase [Mucor mucedo]|uniref:copper/zinc superoxide dismutase n=1 Tax=Mucor mucedo TaxID=29922 RepID=UPI00221E9C70|nr:copper/zinc superoxide dismutase [Mucor mucedo]KAI7890081.1 copper/zinc superoxide dismutase [Mucor mucedo]
MRFSATIAFAATFVASALACADAKSVSAVAYLTSTTTNATGIVRFTQERKNAPTVVSYNITGLAPGQHGFHIHQFGDLSGGCLTFGPHFNPFNETHGGPDAEHRHVGDFGNISADADGNALFNLTSESIKLYGRNSVIGRGIVVHVGEDDLGLGGSPLSNTTGNAGDRAACGIIGYSST